MENVGLEDPLQPFVGQGQQGSQRAGGQMQAVGEQDDQTRPAEKAPERGPVAAVFIALALEPEPKAGAGAEQERHRHEAVGHVQQGEERVTAPVRTQAGVDHVGLHHPQHGETAQHVDKHQPVRPAAADFRHGQLPPRAAAARASPPPGAVSFRYRFPLSLEKRCPEINRSLAPAAAGFGRVAGR